MTVLLMMLCILVYVGAFENTHESSEYNAKRLVRMLLRMPQCCSKGGKLGEGGGGHRIECQRHGLLGRSGNFEI